jgi:hypothetical protein
MPIDYLCTKGRAKVRVLAYRPTNEPLPDDFLRVVIQAMEPSGPIAEDPLHVENCHELNLARELHLMRNEGWEIVANKDMVK